jgi:hypothetical protein
MIAGYRGHGLWWFRIFGYGLHWKDTRIHPLIFSERNGLTKTLQIGHWSFKWLKAI